MIFITPSFLTAWLIAFSKTRDHGFLAAFSTSGTQSAFGLPMQ
jgi:hypothetical protein